MFHAPTPIAAQAMPCDAMLVRQLLRYEPETGKLFWRSRTPEMFSDTARRSAVRACENWNNRYAGVEALASVDASGYPHGGLFGRKAYAHRVIWAICYGHWPETIDHKNGDRTDNRLSNLRSATRSENNCNTRLRASNSSGLKGVSWHKRAGRWTARISVGGKSLYLGLFDTAEAAHAAYCTASVRLHGDFGRTS